MTDTTFLNIDSVTIAYGDDVVVSDLSLSLPVGELAALLGPSGCGKTTLLRAIAGFEPLQTGSISLAGEVLSRAGYTVPPERRAIGMMFQDLALFPHLNVADNIRFGIVGLPRKIQQQRIQMLLDLVGLPDSGRRYPHKLSGGQQQRIALAACCQEADGPQRARIPMRAAPREDGRAARRIY